MHSQDKAEYYKKKEVLFGWETQGVPYDKEYKGKGCEKCAPEHNEHGGKSFRGLVKSEIFKELLNDNLKVYKAMFEMQATMKEILFRVDKLEREASRLIIDPYKNEKKKIIEEAKKNAEISISLIEKTAEYAFFTKVEELIREQRQKNPDLEKLLRLI